MEERREAREPEMCVWMILGCWWRSPRILNSSRTTSKMSISMPKSGQPRTIQGRLTMYPKVSLALAGSFKDFTSIFLRWRRLRIRSGHWHSTTLFVSLPFFFFFLQFWVHRLLMAPRMPFLVQIKGGWKKITSYKYMLGLKLVSVTVNSSNLTIGLWSSYQITVILVLTMLKWVWKKKIQSNYSNWRMKRMILLSIAFFFPS